MENFTKQFIDYTLNKPDEGFFTDWSEQVRQKLSPEFFANFSQLKTDLNRFNLVWKQECVHELNLQKVFIGKKSSISEERRQRGNDAFKKGNDKEALGLYTQAIIRAPHDEGTHLSVALANRSAVLFRTNEYELCVQDVDQAMSHNYPATLHYKVFDRLGQCYQNMGNYPEAKVAFQKAISSLKFAEVDQSKRELWAKELDKKVNHCDKEKESPNKNSYMEDDILQQGLYRNPSLSLPNASDAISLQYSAEFGRYVTCNTVVPSGSVLFQENPFSSVLMSNKQGSFCCHCYKRLIAPLPCKICCNVAFCSSLCRNQAMQTYHRYECEIAGLMAASGMSLNCYLAVRIVAERSLAVLRKANLPHPDEQPMIPDNASPYKADCIDSILRLVALDSMRDPLDLLQKTLMCVIFVKILQLSCYLEHKGDLENNHYLASEDMKIGALLLRILQVVPFNCHELSGISYHGDLSFKNSKSVFLGLALYPTVSFLNHSCFPAVGRYFNGKQMSVVTLRPLANGEMVAENYGPVFTHNGKRERQYKLKSRYWFDCTCQACIQDWPTYDSIPNDYKLACSHCNLKLKKFLNTTVNKNDGTIHKVSDDVDNGEKKCCNGQKKNVQCKKCGSDDFIDKVYDRLQKARKDFDEGKAHMDAQRREEAIGSFSKYINEVIPKYQLPIKDVHVALQALRHLYFHRGTGVFMLPE